MRSLKFQPALLLLIVTNVSNSFVMKPLPALQKILDGPAAVGRHKDEVKAELVVDCKCILGECVLYNDEQNSVWWTDIEGKALYELRMDDLSMSKRFFSKMVGAFGLTNKPHHLIMGFQDGFQLVNVYNSDPLSEYSQGPSVNPRGLPTRLNDGRCDRTGQRFICGAFYGDLPNETVSVFAVEKQGDGRQLKHRPILDKVQITNSLCFSPDGSTMYFCDSPTKVILACDYQDGKLGPNARTVYKWEGEGFPDGSTVDGDGFIWSAVWRKGDGRGRVQRIDPETGRVDFVVQMPDSTSQCTCCCFGGPNLDILFISTAKIGRDTMLEPQAGGLYAVKLPFKGIPESRFQL